VARAPRAVAPRPAATRLAWALCLLSIALVLAPIGALIVVGDRRRLLAWLLLVDGLVLGA
jgi:hypothetical protein